MTKMPKSSSRAQRGDPSTSKSELLAIDGLPRSPKGPRNDGTMVLLLGLTLAALTLGGILAGYRTLAQFDDPLGGWQLQAAIGASLAVYFLAVRLMRYGADIALWQILAVGIGLRLALALAHPMLSSDLYRYGWDGLVQTWDVNPYRYVPANPALLFLRDGVFFANMNRPDYAHTIYPPAAQVFFVLVSAISRQLSVLKLAVAALDIATLWALVRLLDRSGQRRAQLLIYAWNPLVLWEFSNNAHIDALAVLLLMLAVLATLERYPALGGALLGGAVLTKLLPALAFPALWPRGGWRMAAAAALAVAVLYAYYAAWQNVGWQVFGFLGGYRHEEALDTGSGYWLLALLGHAVALPSRAGTIYAVIAVAALAALGAWVAFVRRPQTIGEVAACAGVLIATLTILLSPHYAWYYAWLSAFAALAPSWAAVWLSSAAMALYVQTLPEGLIAPSILFLPALALLPRAIPLHQGTR
jgi:alpha-1,6-mannosyltransferase